MSAGGQRADGQGRNDRKQDAAVGGDLPPAAALPLGPTFAPAGHPGAGAGLDDRTLRCLISPAARTLAPRCLELPFAPGSPDPEAILQAGEGPSGAQSGADRIVWEVRPGPGLGSALAGIPGAQVMDRGERARISAPWQSLSLIHI